MKLVETPVCGHEETREQRPNGCGRRQRSLITEYWVHSRGFAVSPNPCHCQDYDQLMLYPAQFGSEGCSPKMFAEEVTGVTRN